MSVREGLARLEGVESVSEEALLASATCEISPRAGAWLDPVLLSRHIEGIQVGARLRGLEATIKGTLEINGGQTVLRPAGGTERIVLAPLSQKIQLDPRKNQPQPVRWDEQMAFADLKNEAHRHPGMVLVTGPLLVPAAGEPVLEVRQYAFLTPKEGQLRKLTLGLQVNGPYGLGEPWGMIRDGLARLAAIQGVEELPDLARSTCEVRLHPGVKPNPGALAESIGALRVGAALRGVEATLDGWLVKRWGRVKLILPEPIGSVDLKPLRQKIQCDLHSNRAEPIQDHELAAYRFLRAKSTKEPRFVRVIGPFHLAQGGKPALEVRRFALAPGQFATLADEEAAIVAGRRKGRRSESPELDKEPPAAPRKLTASASGDFVTLDWEDNPDPDFGSYNIFRSTNPGGAYIQVAAGIVPSTYRCWVGRDDSSYYFVVTATDYSGNQSAFSNEAAVRSAAVIREASLSE